MREALLGDRSVLVLREPKPVPTKKHECVTYHGATGVQRDHGSIIQCDCGKRYKCRKNLMFEDQYIWVRRLLPWPPRQKGWPK